MSFHLLRYCCCSAIPCIRCSFKFFAFKTFYTKIIGKTRFVKTMLFGFPKPIPSLINVPKFAFRVELNQLEERKLKPFVRRLLEQL